MFSIKSSVMVDYLMFLIEIVICGLLLATQNIEDELYLSDNRLWCINQRINATYSVFH
jgi:hypothetical protein